MFAVSNCRTVLSPRIPTVVNAFKSGRHAAVVPFQNQARTYLLLPFLPTQKYQYHPQSTDLALLSQPDPKIPVSLGSRLFGSNVVNYKLLDSEPIRGKIPILAKLEEAYKIRFEMCQGLDRYPVGYEVTSRLLGREKIATYELHAYTLTQLAKYVDNSGLPTACILQDAGRHCMANENSVIRALYQIHSDNTYTMSLIATAENLKKKGLASFGQLAVALHAQSLGAVAKNDDFQDYTHLGALSFAKLPRKTEAMVRFLNERFEKKIDSGEIKPVEEPSGVVHTFGMN